MKKILLILFLIIGFLSNGQDTNGVFMSYYNGLIDFDTTMDSITEGLIVDFDKSEIQSIYTDVAIPIKINHKKNKIKSSKGNFKFNKQGNNIIAFKSKKKDPIVFQRLNLQKELKTNELKITEFLINNKFKPLNNFIEIRFQSEPYFMDKVLDVSSRRKNLINETWNESGYWYLKEIQRNYFLIFTLSQTDKQNIYQINSISNRKIELIPIQERAPLQNITELESEL